MDGPIKVKSLNLGPKPGQQVNVINMNSDLPKHMEVNPQMIEMFDEKPSLVEEPTEQANHRTWSPLYTAIARRWGTDYQPEAQHKLNVDLDNVSKNAVRATESEVNVSK